MGSSSGQEQKIGDIKNLHGSALRDRVQFTLVCISISSLYQMRYGHVCRKLHQVVLFRRVAAQCFHAVYAEKLDVPYDGRMVPWLCFVASTAVLFARDVGIGMLTRNRYRDQCKTNGIIRS
jgi:hypothetical protein